MCIICELLNYEIDLALIRSNSRHWSQATQGIHGISLGRYYNDDDDGDDDDVIVPYINPSRSDDSSGDGGCQCQTMDHIIYSLH